MERGGTMPERRGYYIDGRDVPPLVELEADVGATCPDRRCGEHSKPVQPVRHPSLPDGPADRCPTCLTTVTAWNQEQQDDSSSPS